MAQWYLDDEAKIVRTALKAKGPYVMAVNPSYGLRRAKLAYSVSPRVAPQWGKYARGDDVGGSLEPRRRCA